MFGILSVMVLQNGMKWNPWLYIPTYMWLNDTIPNSDVLTDVQRFVIAVAIVVTI